MANSSLSVFTIDALVTGSERGLISNIKVAETLGITVFPVCTSIVMASHGHVTDITEVPSDTVQAQLEHLLRVTGAPTGVHIGTLGNHTTVESVFQIVEKLDAPVVLDFTVSGPSGETVLTQRGVDTLVGLMEKADLISINRRDAELVTNGEINSLDDAQVAAQRLHNRGASMVLLRCGTLPMRFFDAYEDPGGDGSPDYFETDLLYNGSDFVLFEAPHIRNLSTGGASSALHLAILAGMTGDFSYEEVIQRAKKFTTDAIRLGENNRMDMKAAAAQLQTS